MKPKIHSIASQGFQSAADAYERGRPGYPAEAVEFLAQACGLRTGAQVLELGPGTGKFSRQMLPFGAALTGIEPVEGMRRKFAALLPGVAVREGSAEQIPWPDAGADAVLAAQAFHWFDGAKALAECFRVLRPGGALGLIWNVRDESVPWVAELSRILEPYELGAPRYKSFEWKKAFGTGCGFGPLQQRSFPHSQLGTAETVVDRMASVSFIAALPDKEKAVVLDRVRALLATHPGTRGWASIETPYSTEVYWCRKL